MEQARRRLDRVTRWVAAIGFSGLVVMAVLTMYDALMRFADGPRIPGFTDIGEVIYAVVIATCFPAGLLQGHNITIRFLGRGLGRAGNAWLESFGALVTLIFFALLFWQFVVLTADLTRSGRTTGTMEFPIAPWWWLTTAIMFLCVPVQVWVFADRLWRALTGREVDPTAQMTSEAIGTGDGD